MAVFYLPLLQITNKPNLILAYLFAILYPNPGEGNLPIPNKIKLCTFHTLCQMISSQNLAKKTFGTVRAFFQLQSNCWVMAKYLKTLTMKSVSVKRKEKRTIK